MLYVRSESDLLSKQTSWNEIFCLFFFFFVGDHSILIVFGKPPKFFVDSENSFEEIREKVNHGWIKKILLLVLLQ